MMTRSWSYGVLALAVAALAGVGPAEARDVAPDSTAAAGLGQPVGEPTETRNGGASAPADLADSAAPDLADVASPDLAELVRAALRAPEDAEVWLALSDALDIDTDAGVPFEELDTAEQEEADVVKGQGSALAGTRGPALAGSGASPARPAGQDWRGQGWRARAHGIAVRARAMTRSAGDGLSALGATLVAAADAHRAAVMFVGGFSFWAAATLLWLSRRRARRPVRAHGRRGAASVRSARVLLSKGLTAAEVAKRTGIARDAVGLLAMAGVAAPAPGARRRSGA